MWCCYQTMGRQAVDVRYAAPDADAIRCTGGWMWCQDCCTRPWNSQMHAGDCLLMKLPGLHLMPMSSDALTVVWLPGLHLMPMPSDALAVVWLPELHLMPMLSDALAKLSILLITWTDNAGCTLSDRSQWIGPQLINKSTDQVDQLIKTESAKLLSTNWSANRSTDWSDQTN